MGSTDILLLFWMILLLNIDPCSCGFIPRPFVSVLTSRFQLGSAHTGLNHTNFNDTQPQIRERAITTELSTCGYLNGNPDLIRTADPGYNCRIDTRNGLWGFCPTSVISAADCGLAGSCVDSHRCSGGCGATDRADLTTFTCRDNFCSTALLTFGIDQTYAYIACDAKFGTDYYHITPVAQAVTTTSTPEPVTTSTSEPEPGSGRSSQEPSSQPPRNSSPRRLSSVGGASTYSHSEATTQSSQQVVSNRSPTSAESAHDTNTEAEVPGNSGEDPSEDSSPSPIQLGAIIGGAIGGLALICATTIAVIYLLRRNHSSRSDTQPEVEQTPTYTEDFPSGGSNMQVYKTLGPQELDDREPQELPGDYRNHGSRYVAELES
ncbi:hypothetical protein SODALDRAFT_328495 [Sodiomyces alkalinus F11]|uniref:Mid2 domain-containing protein n=1 Tax=Sodiomyces alkalinus (strain CBS 110278 / VKM F-3762 / F11) TaxID=1314773 RepID=A0A3N2PNK7_SODAK|nr:hypothetical protein SODALDRAFT_328495 [Sodiomyces alkalinus F11]ROT36121.1 hypothetical protein SODALDRAFT_328495 [Sodiomyces alkalinus F11]